MSVEGSTSIAAVFAAEGVADRGGRGRVSAWDVVRVLLGGVLLVAAGLKAHQLATEPVANRGILTYRWALIVQVELELALGLWLLSGLHRRLIWMLAVLCFAFFSAVTLYKGIIGEASCGCFGKVKISPWYTVVFDVLAVTALVVFRPRLSRAGRARYYRPRMAASVVAVLAAGVPAGVATAIYTPARILPDGTIFGDAHFVLLEPETWVGKPFRLAGHIDVGDRLAQGAWTVVLYHHDCPYCRKAVPRIEDKARAMKGKTHAGQVALIEMPPYAPQGGALPTGSSGCTLGRLSSARDWFVGTPAVICLVDGKVVSAREGQTDPKIAVHGQPAKPVRPATVAIKKVSGPEGGHDFGFVKPGSAHRVVFEIPNVSKAAMAILKVRSECACMKVPKFPRSIQPESAGRIQVDFIAPKKKMDYSKRVLVLTKDPQRSRISLRVKAAVGRPLEVHPRAVDLGTLIAGEQRRFDVTIANRDKRPFRPIYGTASARTCTAMVPRASIPPGGKLSIPVVYRGEETPAGTCSITVRIHTDCPGQPTVQTRVRYAVSSAYCIRPGAVDVGSMGVGEKRHVVLELTATGEDPGRFVTTCKPESLCGVSGTMDVRYAGQRARIQCELVAGRESGPIGGCIRLKLDGHDREVEVPVTGRVRGNATLAHSK